MRLHSQCVKEAKAKKEACFIGQEGRKNVVFLPKVVPFEMGFEGSIGVQRGLAEHSLQREQHE